MLESPSLACLGDSVLETVEKGLEANATSFDIWSTGYNADTGAHSVTFNVFTFSLMSSVRLMWNDGAQFLAVLIFDVGNSVGALGLVGTTALRIDASFPRNRSIDGATDFIQAL